MKECIHIDCNKLQKLLVTERLDIIIKYLYIEAYIEKKNYRYYLDLYKRHIAYRTGGIEDKKRSINEYIKEFNTLIDSIRINGFDKNFAIPVSKYNGIILNGAHRLACC